MFNRILVPNTIPHVNVDSERRKAQQKKSQSCADHTQSHGFHVHASWQTMFLASDENDVNLYDIRISRQKVS